MDCNIYQRSCNNGLNHHLRIDANTKNSPEPHTDQSVLSTQLAPLGLVVFKLKSDSRSDDCEECAGGNQVFQY